MRSLSFLALVLVLPLASHASEAAAGAVHDSVCTGSGEFYYPGARSADEIVRLKEKGISDPVGLIRQALEGAGYDAKVAPDSSRVFCYSLDYKPKDQGQADRIQKWTFDSRDPCDQGGDLKGSCADYTPCDKARRQVDLLAHSVSIVVSSIDREPDDKNPGQAVCHVRVFTIRRPQPRMPSSLKLPTAVPGGD